MTLLVFVRVHAMCTGADGLLVQPSREGQCEHTGAVPGDAGAAVRPLHSPSHHSLCQGWDVLISS